MSEPAYSLYAFSIEAAPSHPHDAQASVLFALDQMTFAMRDTGAFPSIDDIPTGYGVKVHVSIARLDDGDVR